MLHESGNHERYESQSAVASRSRELGPGSPSLVFDGRQVVQSQRRGPAADFRSIAFANERTPGAFVHFFREA